MLLATDFSHSAAQLHTGGSRSAVARVLSSTGLVLRPMQLLGFGSVPPMQTFRLANPRNPLHLDSIDLKAGETIVSDKRTT